MHVQTNKKHKHRQALEGHIWHADHIHPVYKGGGMCTIENLRTLCIPCHSAVTKQQAAERAAARLYAGGQRKITAYLSPAGSQQDLGSEKKGEKKGGKKGGKKGEKDDKVVRERAKKQKRGEKEQERGEKDRVTTPAPRASPVLQVIRLSSSPEHSQPV